MERLVERADRVVQRARVQHRAGHDEVVALQVIDVEGDGQRQARRHAPRPRLEVAVGRATLARVDGLQALHLGVAVGERGARRAIERAHQRLEVPGAPAVVVVEVGDQRAARGGHAGVARRGDAAVGFAPHEARGERARVGRGERLDQRARCGRARVADHDHLEVAPGLRRDRVERLEQAAASIEVADDDRDARAGHGPTSARTRGRPRPRRSRPRGRRGTRRRRRPAPAWASATGSASGMSRRFCGVSMMPGAIALTRMPSGFHSAARLFARWTTAAFIAAETATPGPDDSAGRLPTSTTEPPRGFALSSG